MLAQNASNQLDNYTSIGKSLYEGTHAVYAPDAKRIHDGRDAAITLPAEQSACVACHRKSGLGSFEGGVAVPPIAGHLLFNAYDTATTRRYNFPNTLRVRPAYDETALRKLLASGSTPDGIQISPLMPRYDFSDAEVKDLATHLKGLTAERAPGVSDSTVLFATITTDDVSPSDVNDLMSTLNAFFATKNAGTRGELGRRAQAERKEQTMYLRYRQWQLRHWQLKGAPDSWARQLDEYWAKEPVFAVLSGLSGQRWQPVHEFCARTATPCLLPMVALPPQTEDFYSIYFSRGLVAQAEQALQHLLGLQKQTEVQNKNIHVLTAEGVAGEQQRMAIEQVIAGKGFTAVNITTGAISKADSAAEIVISTLNQAQTSSLLQSRGVVVKKLILLGGIVKNPDILPANNKISSTVSDNLAIVSVSDYVPVSKQRQALTRAQVWLRARNLKIGNPLIGSNALFVATLATESLMHVDDKFSREYCVEKLEHNLENMPPMTAHERLSIGPRQRFASKQAQIYPPLLSD